MTEPKIVLIIGTDVEPMLQALQAYPSTYRKYIHPENSRHPQDQCGWIERVCRLCNDLDMRVAAVTNSPYIIDHVINLVHLSLVPDKSVAEGKMFTDIQPVPSIAPTNVVVYLFENGKRKKVSKYNRKERQFSIDWGTFSDVSERVCELYYDIIT